MTPKMKPAQLVEIDGKQYVVAKRADKSGACRYCAFRGADHCGAKSPQRIACGEFSHLLEPAKYITLKLKGEVL